MNFPPKTPSKVAPGMTFPVEAGEQYTITDDKGEALLIDARDDPQVIDYLAQVDLLIVTFNTTAGVDPFTSPMVQQNIRRLMGNFDLLPRRILDQMPSRRSGPVIVR